MATLIIGDIHGCWAELQALLDKVGPGERDLILAVGDLVNRGPDSPRVLDFFRQTPNAASIRGNHEERHLEARRGNVPLGFAHEVARLQWSAADYQEAVTAMGRLRRRRELREATVVHAYWEAGVPAAKQRLKPRRRHDRLARPGTGHHDIRLRQQLIQIIKRPRPARLAGQPQF